MNPKPCGRTTVKQFWLGKNSKTAENGTAENAEVPGQDGNEEFLYEEAPVAEENIPEPQPFVYKEKRSLRWWQILLLTLLLIVFGGVGGLFYYVSNIDWNQHKDKISARFSELTGKRIVFDGPVQLSVLPSPYLLAEDIKIYNPGDAEEEPLAKIKSLVANLNLMPLVNGDFEVKMMELKEPDIRFEVMEDGSLNWESSFGEAQRQNMESVQVTLDSVMIEKAKFNFIDPAREIDLRLDNLNAEIIAQSLFGPYRIEGSYIKDNNPEGFAFSIGKLSSGFATTVNMVVNQPASETFVRFDGSVMPQNNAVNGNLILESKKLMDFINYNFNDFKLKKEYDYPLALSLEIKSNKTKIDITNFVMKYGDTAGAGNLLIPLNEDKGDAFRPKVELGFNFTDLDLTPAVALLKEFIAKYNTTDASYNPEVPFDLLADFKSIKSKYENEQIKDFQFSFDFIDNNLDIRSFSAVVPGDTSLKLNGNVFSELGHLTYRLDTNVQSDELRQTLTWLNMLPEANSDTVYKRINLNATIAGTFDKISVSPLDLNLDKTSFKGDVGIITGSRPNYYLSGKADMINFDSYVKPLPKEAADKDFVGRMAYRFSKLGFMNDFDADLNLVLDLGIYENSPFENTKFQGTLKRGVLDIRDLDMPSAVNASLNLKGAVKGFGQAAEFENLKYDLQTKDFSAFLNKLGVNAPDIDLKTLKNFSAKGIATGSLNKMALKNVVKLENINLTYGGQVSRARNIWNYNGNLEVKSPDFVKMLNDFNIAYRPKTFALGMFNLKTKVTGSSRLFKANNLEFNIGPNIFKGKLAYDKRGSRPVVTTNLSVNKFEFDKFFYNNVEIRSDNKQNFRAQSGNERVDFLARPVFDNTRINYDFFKTFDLSGRFNAERISIPEAQFDFAGFRLDIKDAVAKLSEFKSSYHGGTLSGSAELNMADEAAPLNGKVDFQKYKITDGWGGDKYQIKSGTVNAKADFRTFADSFSSLWDNLEAKIDLNVDNVVWNGWNLEKIHADLVQREVSDGLTLMIKNNLSEGVQNFEFLKAVIDLRRGKYTIKDATLRFGNGTVVLNDNGDLGVWETNADFKVKYDSPAYLPSYAFSMTGNLSSPVVEADAEDLAVMYNNRKAEIEAQEEAEKKAAQDILDKNMQEQMLQVSALDSELQNVVKTELASRQEQAKSPEVIEAYKKLENDIKKIEEDIAGQNLRGKTLGFDDALLGEIAENNKKISEKLKTVKDKIAEEHINNLRYVINDVSRQIIEQNDQAKEIGKQYRADSSAFNKRLLQVDTHYTLQDDENVRRLRNKIDGNLLALDNISGQVQSDVARLQGVRDAAELDKAATEMSAQLADALKYVPSLTEARKELAEYTEGRVAKEEEDFRKRREEEELKRKLEENTGSISVKGTGVSKTVVRGIDEIQKSESAVEKENVEVLSFSDENPSGEKEKTEVAKEAPKPQAENAPVLNKTQGTITKASGVIIRK